MSTTLFVGHLGLDVQEDEVRTLFEKYGTINSVRVRSGRNYAYAFVDIENRDDADKAIDSVNDTEFLGNRISVEVSRGRGGGGGGGFRGGYGGGGGGGGCYSCGEQGHFARECPNGGGGGGGYGGRGGGGGYRDRGYDRDRGYGGGRDRYDDRGRGRDRYDDRRDDRDDRRRQRSASPPPRPRSRSRSPR